MPIQTCQSNNKPGYKWGNQGKCYTYTPGDEDGRNRAKRKAYIQGLAIGGSDSVRIDLRDINESTENAIESIRIQRSIAKITKHKFKKPPKWLYPHSAENEYRKFLLSISRNMRDLTKEILIPQLESLVYEADLSRPSNIRHDNWSENADRLIDSLFIAMERDFPELRFTLLNIGQKVNSFNNAQWRKIMRSVMGVEYFTREPWQDAMIASFTHENTALITRTVESIKKDISRIVQEGLKNGKRWETIRAELLRGTKLKKGVFHKLDTRMKIIARDQVGKLNGQLTEYRQSSMGITKYIWRTSLDERVRGKPGGRFPDAVPSHWDREGKTYYWRKPPRGGHPGSAILCRCYAEADFSKIEKEVGL